MSYKIRYGFDRHRAVSPKQTRLLRCAFSAALMLIAGVFYPEEYLCIVILAAVLVVVGGLPALVRHPAGVWLGLTKVKVVNENQNRAQTHDEQTVFEDPTGLFDVHNYDAWDEMTDNAFVY